MRLVLICVTATSGLLLIVAGFYYTDMRPHAPLAMEAASCAEPPPPDELPNASFARRGGKVTRDYRVWRERGVLTVEDIAQGRDLNQYEKLELIIPSR